MDRYPGLQMHWFCQSRFAATHRFSKCYVHNTLNCINLCGKAVTRPFRSITRICPKVEAYLLKKTGKTTIGKIGRDQCTCIPFRADTHLTSHHECEPILKKELDAGTLVMDG